MKSYKLFYATNRRHVGDQWNPDGYDGRFSDSGTENLRFGKLELDADVSKIKQHINKDLRDMGSGDGKGLSDYLTDCAKKANINAYYEDIKENEPEKLPNENTHGSMRFFKELKSVMMSSNDVVIYIHGYNVKWEVAVGQALTLQIMLNEKSSGKSIQVVLFSWPSNGSLMPWVAYASDRSEAHDSGYTVGRAFLKLRDYLLSLRRDNNDSLRRDNNELCEQEIHLVCHSMGNYLLENVVVKMDLHHPRGSFPRIFENIFLCAPDVDDDVLEEGKPLGRITEFAKSVSVYHNEIDVALKISDLTKRNPDRLGTSGVARPGKLHRKIHQIDCTPIVGGFVEHGYFLSGKVVEDICLSIENMSQENPNRHRYKIDGYTNLWKMV